MIRECCLFFKQKTAYDVRISDWSSDVCSSDLPVTIDIAAAQGQVSAIDCPDTAEQARDTRVTVQAGSGLVNAYIGALPAGAMTRPMPPLSAADVRSVRIVNVLGVVTVDSRAVAQPVMGASGALEIGRAHV